VAGYSIALDLCHASWKVQDRCREATEGYGLVASPPLLTLLEIPEEAGEERLLSLIEESTRAFGHLPFLLDGWKRRREKRDWSLGIRVLPAPPLLRWLEAFRDGLSVSGIALSPVLTVSEGIPGGKMRAIWRDLGEPLPWWERLIQRIIGPEISAGHYVRPLTLPVDSLRILLLKGGNPVMIRDLPSGRWLTPDQAGDPDLREETLSLYRRERGYELSGPPATEREIYLASDLHLGHEGINDFCGRPFTETETMNRVLVQNWNSTVRPGGRVFFIGDLSYNMRGSGIRDFRASLNGRITYIRGNHDHYLRGAVEEVRFSYKGLDFCMLHNPRKAPPDFSGWIIHGHTHNTNLRRHPFIDPVHRRVNVSAEVTGYRPVPMSLICQLIRRLEGTSLSLMTLSDNWTGDTERPQPVYECREGSLLMAHEHQKTDDRG